MTSSLQSASVKFDPSSPQVIQSLEKLDTMEHFSLPNSTTSAVEAVAKASPIIKENQNRRLTISDEAEESSSTAHPSDREPAETTPPSRPLEQFYPPAPTILSFTPNAYTTVTRKADNPPSEQDSQPVTPALSIDDIQLNKTLKTLEETAVKKNNSRKRNKVVKITACCCLGASVISIALCLVICGVAFTIIYEIYSSRE